ncbi:histidine phosphatase family protein [Oerskovia sp. M15]
MSARTVVFLRHGRTEYNAAMRLQGQVDIPLDAVGHWQAEQGHGRSRPRTRRRSWSRRT